MASLNSGAPVLVGITDPWDFATNNGDVREGVIREVFGVPGNPNVVTVELLTPVCQGDICVSLIYGYSRHSGGLVAMKNGENVPCNFSDLYGDGGAPKGAVNFLGTIRLI